jgi:rhodanese-related sulfurtransferase
MEQAKRGEIIVIDVRPRAEFDQAHLPYARSMPLDEIAQRLAELSKGAEIVAYCRGPFCLFAEEAAQLLKTRGRKVSKLLDGVAEWTSAGMPLETKETT